MTPLLSTSFVILAMELARAAPTPPPTDFISFWCGTPGDVCMNDENWAVCRDLVSGGCHDILMMESCPLQFDCGSGYKVPELPTFTRAECADVGGTVVGDPGDGSLLTPGFVCPPGSAAGGVPPMGTIRYEGGDPIASDGEVCCPTEEEVLSQTAEPSPGPTSEPTTPGPTTFEPTSESPTFEPTNEPTFRNEPTYVPSSPPSEGDVPRSDPSALSGSCSVWASRIHMLSLVVSMSALLLTAL